MSLSVATAHLVHVQVEDPYLSCLSCRFYSGEIMGTTCAFDTATMCAGTHGFQSPKQLKGEGSVNSSDTYVLHRVLTELFGEKPLWECRTSHVVVFKVAGERAVLQLKHCTPAVGHCSALPLSQKCIAI